MSLIIVGSLKWNASKALDVVGYRVYWTVSALPLNYSSRFVDVGNVTEVHLPFAGMPLNCCYKIGVVSIDRTGNISDISIPVIVSLSPHKRNIWGTLKRILKKLSHWF
jgi:hypothetical protein